MKAKKQRKSKKYFLKDGDRVYSTGCWLVYDETRNCLLFDGIEDDTFFDGEHVEFSQEQNELLDKPYIERS